MSPHEFAILLYRKALEDQFTVEKLLPDPDSPDDVIGFHAQQAVEKFLKAVLTHGGVDYRRTHDLVELLDLLADSAIAVPATAGIELLTPFAVTLRYDSMDLDHEDPLDRTWALSCILGVRSWAEAAIGLKTGDSRN